MRYMRKQLIPLIMLVGSSAVSSLILPHSTEQVAAQSYIMPTQPVRLPDDLSKRIPDYQSTHLTQFQDSPLPEQQVTPPVQVFDMQQERIIKTFKNEGYFQDTAKQWLKQVTGLSPQLNIGSSNGYIVRIPLVETYTLKLSHLSIELRDIFLVYVPDRKPLLLIFSKERKPYLLETSADVQSFIQRMLAPTGPGASRE